MAVSKVSICNRALDLIGAEPITALTDPGKVAALCNRNFDVIRDQVLRSYPWNSAMRRAQLAAEVTPPLFGFANQFALPEGPEPLYCLRLYQVEGELEYDLHYKVEGRKILCDEAGPLNIIYIARVEDTRQFDPLLDEAIAAQLAVYLCTNLTESGSRTQGMQEYMKEVMRQARITDAQEGKPDPFTVRTWREARL
jgi:hypothetical protein